MKTRITFLTALFLLLSLTASAQNVLKFRTTDFSFKIKKEGIWGSWSSWESASMLVVVNLDSERITVYSKSVQQYDILDMEDKGIDSDGDRTFKFGCVDQDGDRCSVRVLIRKSGTKQLYVDFADIMWVYNMQNVN